MNVIALSKNDIENASRTLFMAFRNDPLLIWMFGGHDTYDQHALWAIKSWVNWCILYGRAIATPNCEAVALLKKPGNHKFSFWNIIRSGMWKTPAVVGTSINNKMMVIDKLIHNEQSKTINTDNFWYLWMIGTDPNLRQQGHAKLLINHILEVAHDNKLSCYLETASELNVSIYQNFGFKKLSSVQPPDSAIQLSFMAT